MYVEDLAFVLILIIGYLCHPVFVWWNWFLLLKNLILWFVFWVILKLLDNVLCIDCNKEIKYYPYHSNIELLTFKESTLKQIATNIFIETNTCKKTVNSLLFFLWLWGAHCTMYIISATPHYCESNNWLISLRHLKCGRLHCSVPQG